jgi:outer membrane protein TolC
MQRLQLEATYLTLTSNVALAAVQEASVRGQIDATQKIIKIETDLLKFLKQQLEAGLVSEVDVAAQEAALAQAEEALPPLQKALAVQRDLMTALTGHFAGEGLPERFEFSNLHLPHDLPVSLSSMVVEQRPDVRAAEANLHSATALVGVAIANRVPVFNLTGNVGRQASQFPNLFNPSPAFLFWTITGSVTQTVFDGFTLEQKQRAAELAVVQAKANRYADTVALYQALGGGWWNRSDVEADEVRRGWERLVVQKG